MFEKIKLITEYLELLQDLKEQDVNDNNIPDYQDAIVIVGRMVENVDELQDDFEKLSELLGRTVEEVKEKLGIE